MGIRTKFQSKCPFLCLRLFSIFLDHSLLSNLLFIWPSSQQKDLLGASCLYRQLSLFKGVQRRILQSKYCVMDSRGTCRPLHDFFNEGLEVRMVGFTGWQRFFRRKCATLANTLMALEANLGAQGRNFDGGSCKKDLKSKSWENHKI